MNTFYVLFTELHVTHAFIHSGYFYSASSSSLLLRGASDYSIDTVLEVREIRVKDLPKVPTWWLELNLNLRPSRCKALNLYWASTPHSANVHMDYLKGINVETMTLTQKSYFEW